MMLQKSLHQPSYLRHNDVVKNVGAASGPARCPHPGAGRAADPRARAVHRRHARRPARAHACRHPAPSRQPAGRGPHRDQDGQDLREPGPRPPGQGLRHHRRGPQRVRARLRRPGHQRAALPGRDGGPGRDRRVRPQAGVRPGAQVRPGGGQGRPGPPGPGAGRGAVRRRLRRLRGPGARDRRLRAEGGEQLCQHHCPVAHVAAEFPQLCEAETEAFGRLLGTPVQRLATIAHGDGICTTHVTCVGKAAARRGLL